MSGCVITDGEVIVCGYNALPANTGLSCMSMQSCKLMVMSFRYCKAPAVCCSDTSLIADQSMFSAAVIKD